MQERFFEGEDGTTGPNMKEWTFALTQHRDTLSALGSAPYVERSLDLARQNISHILSLCLTHTLHADFHLDYDLRTGEEAENEALIWYVIEKMRKEEDTQKRKKMVYEIYHIM